MFTFELFIDDDRYSVPTLRLLSTDNAAWAHNLAKLALQESSHHLGVELYGGERRLLRLGSFRSPRPGAARAHCVSF